MAEDIRKKGITIENAYKYLDGYDDIAGEKVVPEHLMPSIDNKIRTEMDYYNKLSVEEVKYDKGSSDHMYIQREKEKIGRGLIKLKDQEMKWKNGLVTFKEELGGMNAGTKNEDLHAKAAVYGAQQRAIHISDDYKMSFLLDEVEVSAERSKAIENFENTGEWNESEGEIVSLDDVGSRPIIQEPYVTKTFVFDLAEKSKNDKDSGKKFDEKWTYNSSLNNFDKAGPKGTIGAAFADLSADGQTKSFAEMYDEGMNAEYYINPDTGEALPAGLEWMQDPANSKVLAKLLAKYITNVMKDIHGPTINEKTGQVKKSQSQLAQDLIKKYSK